ncbi:MAG: MFS transporter [Phycisphaeraceae bacterium]|nr:MFS transporter [Phycisphaeraceae bacterium]
MTHELSNIEKIRKLPWALGADAFNTIYCYLAFTGPIFLLYLDKLELSKGQIGLILALFPFCGLVAPFTGPWAARIGLKRVFLTFWIVRQFVLLGILLSPWVAKWYGMEAAFLYTAAVLLVFALSRSIAEGAYAPWTQEYVPATIRGKFSAIQTIVIMLVGATTVAVGGWVLGESPDVNRFLWLIGSAFFFGVVSLLFYARIPGGGSLPPGEAARQRARRLGEPFRDPQFRMFLSGSALIHLSWLAMTAFLPLFMKEQIGLGAKQVVSLEAVALLAGVMSSFLWGWAADRYGGKPVLLCNLGVMLLVYPVGLLLLPREQAISFPLALCLAFVVGLVSVGWGIGYGRHLFVALVPPQLKASYLAIHTAVIGICAGTAPLLGGQILELTRDVSVRLGPLHIDAYSPLFIGAMAIGGLGFWRFSLMQGGPVPVRRFAVMFLQGDPVSALRAIIGYQLAGDEHKRVSLIERLGETKSLLSIEELIAALDDPSFNVRHEAIISIARTRRDPRLTEAMIRALTEGDPDLRMTAAWALGRMGDPAAIEPLRQALDSDYPLLRARAARALGTLSDRASSDKLLQLFLHEEDAGLRVAYGAALGQLGRQDAVEPLLDFLCRESDERARREISLAVAMLLTSDEHALRLWRRMHDNPGDTLGGILLGLKRRLPAITSLCDDPTRLSALLEQCARAFGHYDLPVAVNLLKQIVPMLRLSVFSPTSQTVIRAGMQQLEAHGHDRLADVFLLVHTLHMESAKHV